MEAIEYLLNHEDDTYFDTVMRLALASFQTGIGFAFEFMPNLTAIYFLSQTDNEVYVGAYGLGQMLCRAYGLGILNGLGCGLETLVSQAYGAGKFELCCALYYKAIFLCGVLLLPISLLLYVATNLFGMINQNKELIENTKDYVLWMILYIFLNGIFVNTKVFLNGQNVYHLQFYTQSISSILCLLFNYLLVQPYGIVGCAISSTLTELCNNVLLFGFIKATHCCENTSYQFKAHYIHLHGCYNFLKTALPIGAILWFEWICFDFYTIQVSFLSNPMINTNFILISIMGILYSFSYGIAIAATTLVGNEMGRKQIKLAKQYAQMSLLLLGLFLIIQLALLWSLRKLIFHFMTNDPNEYELALELLPIITIEILLDQLQAVLSALVRGIGREKYALYSFIACYLGFGQLSAYLFCSVFNLELFGIWIGVSLGSFLYDLIQILSLTKNDWNKQADEISVKMERLSHQKQPVSELELSNYGE